MPDKGKSAPELRNGDNNALISQIAQIALLNILNDSEVQGFRGKVEEWDSVQSR
jgi:hypothetical protein